MDFNQSSQFPLVELRLAGRKLKDTDILSKSDPYVVVY